MIDPTDIDQDFDLSLPCSASDTDTEMAPVNGNHDNGDTPLCSSQVEGDVQCKSPDCSPIAKRVVARCSKRQTPSRIAAGRKLPKAKPRSNLVSVIGRPKPKTGNAPSWMNPSSATRRFNCRPVTLALMSLTLEEQKEDHVVSKKTLISKLTGSPAKWQGGKMWKRKYEEEQRETFPPSPKTVEPSPVSTQFHECIIVSLFLTVLQASTVCEINKEVGLPPKVPPGIGETEVSYQEDYQVGAKNAKYN